MKNIRTMVLISAVVALGTTFSLDFFMEGFIITLSIILLPILLYANSHINPFQTCIFVAVISPGFRMLLTYMETHNLQWAFAVEAPSVLFYVAYGLIYTWSWTENSKHEITRHFMTLLMADFFSNLTEVSIRAGTVPHDYRLVKALFTIAIVRAVIAVCGIIGLKYYKSFLSREEHESRYRRLLLMMSSFKSEIYFMNMNMKNIESIMGKSFKAYKIADEGGVAEEFRTLVLDISKDVHEIKKDYIRVIKGLEELSETRMEIKPMNIRDIVGLLIHSLDDVSGDQKATVDVVTRVNADFWVRDHFYLMSILRNLVVNAIEACGGNGHGRIELNISQEGELVHMKVRDNGNGIKSADAEFIFNPGFSTKYNPSSGDMNRGLGLTLVRELIEQHFGGSIALESVFGAYTLFHISIPKMKLEGVTPCDFA